MAARTTRIRRTVCRSGTTAISQCGANSCGDSRGNEWTNVALHCVSAAPRPRPFRSAPQGRPALPSPASTALASPGLPLGAKPPSGICPQSPRAPSCGAAGCTLCVRCLLHVACCVTCCMVPLPFGAGCTWSVAEQSTAQLSVACSGCNSSQRRPCLFVSVFPCGHRSRMFRAAAATLCGADQ